jgi:hypothetical protein
MDGGVGSVEETGGLELHGAPVEVECVFEGGLDALGFGKWTARAAGFVLDGGSIVQITQDEPSRRSWLSFSRMAARRTCLSCSARA